MLWFSLVTGDMIGDHEGSEKTALQRALVTWREP